MANTVQKAEDPLFKLEGIDFGRRQAVEKEIEKARQTTFIPPANVIFDESNNFIIYPTLLGIKIVNIKTNKLVKVLGKVENTERFLGIALFQGIPSKQGESAAASLGSGIIMANASAIEMKKEDPCIFALAFKKVDFIGFQKENPKNQKMY